MTLTDMERFERYAYPLTTAEVIDRHGDDELTLVDGTETLAEVLSGVGSETFESREDLESTVYGAVSSKAIGRKFYTDRDPIPPGTDGPDPLSF